MRSLRTRRETKTYKGHTDWIYAVAVSPDEQTIASAGIDRTIRLSSRSRNETRSFTQPHVIRQLIWAPDGSVLISGSQDPLIRVINASDGSIERTLEGHRNWVLALSFSADGALLGSGSGDNTIRLWNWPSGDALAVLEGHTRPVLGLAFSPTGRMLASIGADTQVRIWDADSQNCLYILRGHTAPVMAVAFFPDGRRLATGGEDETIRIWDTETGTELAMWRIERPYERVNISGATGITEAQRGTLQLLGAIDEEY